MLLRAKNGKLILRTTILISLILLYTKASKPLWTLLSKMRVVCSPSKLTRWIQEQPDKKINNRKVMFFSFDNCDFFRHVTNVRTTHKSTMIHTCTQIVADIEEEHDLNPEDLWNKVEQEEFVEMLCGDFDTANAIANEAFSSISEVVASDWLKFAPVEGLESDFSADITIMQPLIPCNTSTYDDVNRILVDFHANHIKEGATCYAFVSVDQACHSLVWNLKKRHPHRFSWVVPIPGEWHWTWHILKAIIKVWGASHFVPWSKVLGFAAFDVDCKVFHYGEDFLQIVTIALHAVVKKLMTSLACNTCLELLHKVHGHSQLYEVIYMLVYYLCPYWYTRSAIKRGKYEIVNNLWSYWLHLFIATKKWKYIQLTIRFQYVLQSLDPEVVDIFNKHQFFIFW